RAVHPCTAGLNTEKVHRGLFRFAESGTRPDSSPRHPLARLPRAVHPCTAGLNTEKVHRGLFRFAESGTRPDSSPRHPLARLPRAVHPCTAGLNIEKVHRGLSIRRVRYTPGLVSATPACAVAARGASLHRGSS